MMHFKGTQLHSAAAKGDLEGLKSVLARGAHVNCRRKDGYTALFIAAYFGRNNVIQELTARGASVLTAANDGRQPIHAAAERGHADTIRLLVQLGASVNPRDSELRIPFVAAVENGHQDAIKALVQLQPPCEFINVLHNHIDSTGRTAMHIAAARGRFDTMCTLAALGSPVDDPDREGRTPLHAAAENNRAAIIKPLINRGAEINRRDLKGHTALDLACACGHEEVVRNLIALGAPINGGGDGDDNYFSPMHIAVYYSQLTIVRTLVSLGASLSARSRGGCTPLHAAAIHGDIITLSTLLDLGASTEIADDAGCTALHAAVAAGRSDHVRMLLLRRDGGGANILASTKTGATVMHIAAEIGNEGLLVALAELGANCSAVDASGRSPVHSAAAHGHCGCVRILVGRHDLDICAAASNGFTPLLEAARAGNSTTSQTVMSLVAAKSGDDLVVAGEKAVLAAARLNCAAAITTLAAINVDVSKPYPHCAGLTALHVAAVSGSVSAISELLSLGAPVNARTPTSEFTAVFLAAIRGHNSVVAALVAAGGFVNIPDWRGRLPILVASKRRHANVLRELAGAMLRQAGVDVQHSN